MTGIVHKAYSRMNGSDTVVLCVHGIQGSPVQFDWLMERVPACVDLLCVLLPGHGKTSREFAKTGWREWIGYIDRVYRDLAARYKRVIYIGHSMGCLLGIIAAGRGAAWRSMILLACPLRLHLTFRYLRNNLKAAFQPGSADPYVSAIVKSNSISSDHPFGFLMYLKPYMGLLKLVCIARKAVKQIDIPMIVFQSEKDEIVSAGSLKYFMCEPNAVTCILPDSGHSFYSAESKKTVVQNMLGVLEKCRGIEKV